MLFRVTFGCKVRLLGEPGIVCLLVRLLLLSPQTVQTALKTYPILLCDISKDKRAGIQGCLAKYPCSFFFQGFHRESSSSETEKSAGRKIYLGTSKKCGVKTEVVLHVR